MTIPNIKMLEMLVEISYKKATMLYYYFPNFWVVNVIGLGGRKLGAECAPSGTQSMVRRRKPGGGRNTNKMFV